MPNTLQPIRRTEPPSPRLPARHRAPRHRALVVVASVAGASALAMAVIVAMSGLFV